MGESCKDVQVLKLININRALTREVKEGGIERGQCVHGLKEDREEEGGGGRKEVWQRGEIREER